MNNTAAAAGKTLRNGAEWGCEANNTRQNVSDVERDTREREGERAKVRNHRDCVETEILERAGGGRESDRQTERNRETERGGLRERERQTDRQTGKQTGGQAGRQTETD